MIRQIDKLPEQKKKVTQRDHIRWDLEEARQKNITRFELIGDYYNYNTLAATVREELQRKIEAQWRELTKPFLDIHFRPYMKDWRSWASPKEGFCTLDQFQQYCCGLQRGFLGFRTKVKEIFSVSSLKGQDGRKHVYIEVDWKSPEWLYKQGLGMYEKKEVQDAIRKDTQESLDSFRKYREQRKGKDE